MAVITIPFDYDERKHASIVPICIADRDAEGNLIYPGWFERGVVPVADPLRKIANRVLHDTWRVSEIAEYAVHSLWRTHRDSLGDEPSLRVLSNAHWHAEDLLWGGRRARRGTEVELFESTLLNFQDTFDVVRDLEARATLDRIVEQLDHLGLHDVRDMVPMMLRNCDAHEFVQRFGQSRNTLSQRFYRGMRRAARAAGIRQI